MDSASKIAFGIVGAAVVLLVGFVGYDEFERQRDIAESAAIMQNIAGGFSTLAHESQQQMSEYASQQISDARYRQAYAYAQQQRHALAPNQRCVGGVVVQVDGATYTQLGSISNPVRCVGGMADQALR